MGRFCGIVIKLINLALLVLCWLITLAFYGEWHARLVPGSMPTMALACTIIVVPITWGAVATWRDPLFPDGAGSAA